MTKNTETKTNVRQSAETAEQVGGETQPGYLGHVQPLVGRGGRRRREHARLDPEAGDYYDEQHVDEGKQVDEYDWPKRPDG